MLVTEGYFARRSGLRELMGHVDVLVGEIPLPVREGELPLFPGRIWLFGEGGVGKSSLLDRLLGVSLREKYAEGKTREIRFYGYGAVWRQVECEGGLRCEREIETLRDLEWVDTPELGELDGGGMFCEVGDVRVVVFSSGNPWSPVSWDFLSELSREQLERTVLVLSKGDVLGEGEVEILLGHLGELCIKRIGHRLPLYVLGQGDAFVLNWEDFSRELLKRLSGSRRVREMEEALRVLGLRELEVVECRLMSLLGGVKHSHDFLRLQEEEIEEMQVRFIEQLPVHLRDVSNIFHKETAVVASGLNHQLNVVLSFVRLMYHGQLPSRMGKQFQEHLTEAVKRVASLDAEQIVNRCLHHHEHLLERARHELGMELDREKWTKQRMDVAKRRFIENLGERASERVSYLNIHQNLLSHMRLRHRSLYCFAALMLGGFLGGGVVGMMGIGWLSKVFFGLGVLFLVMFVWICVKSRLWIVQMFQQQLLSTCERFASELRGDYESALNEFFQEYSSSLGEIKRSIAKEKLVLDPLYERWGALHRKLRDFE